MGSDEHLYFFSPKRRRRRERYRKNPAWGCLLINHRASGFSRSFFLWPLSPFFFFFLFWIFFSLIFFFFRLWKIKPKKEEVEALVPFFYIFLDSVSESFAVWSIRPDQVLHNGNHWSMKILFCFVTFRSVLAQQRDDDSYKTGREKLSCVTPDSIYMPGAGCIHTHTQQRMWRPMVCRRIVKSLGDRGVKKLLETSAPKRLNVWLLVGKIHNSTRRSSTSKNNDTTEKNVCGCRGFPQKKFFYGILQEKN